MLHLKIEQQKYGRNAILENINQPYERGRIHGLLGENGAGKTTLFHCMANLIPFKGERMIPECYTFGYLPAELYMYPMITGNEFLRFFISAKDQPYLPEETKRLNNIFDLPLGNYADTYSTGMLKKLYLLGLLLQHNDILLLDEPFNGLDFKSAAFVTALIENVREQGRTVFVASHDMDHLFSYAETISLLNNKTLTFYSGKDSFAQIGTSIREEALAKVRGAGL